MSANARSVVVVTQYFPPETGAAPTRWDELTKRWSADASVTVLTSAPDYPEGELYDGYDNGWVHRETRGDVDVIYTKTVTSSSGNLSRRSLKFLWFMLVSLVVGLRYTSPTTVVATSPQPLTGVSAWIIARAKGARFVFEVRDLWPESILAVSEFDNRLVIAALEYTVTFLYRRSDALVVVSRAFVEPIARTGVDPTKIRYHPNGVDLEFYRVDDEREVPAGVGGDHLTVSYVGTIGRAHGLSVVLEAARDLEDVQFVLVGDGAEREELAARAANCENVTFAGRRPKAEVPHVLNEADVALVHLKPREVFETVIPSKLLEAMAAGLPVVLGVEGEAARILSEADGGVTIEPGNAEELVAAVEQLRDGETRRRLGENGRAYVVEEFDWETIAGEYVETVDGSPETNLSA